MNALHIMKKVSVNEEGQGMSEYGLLLAAVVSLVVLIAVTGLGDLREQIGHLFQSTADAMAGTIGNLW